MIVDILSLFPAFFRGVFDVSMLMRARDRGLLEVRHTDIRDFAEGKHRKVDDRPFGGGPGMLLKPEPLTKAIRSLRKPHSHVVYLSPQGELLTAAKSKELARYEHLILICGHYEGIDERVVQNEVDEEISIGEYVLTSGCPAAVVLVDAVSRFIPGVIGHPDAVEQDSFQNDGLLDAPQFTRPEEFEKHLVPKVLLNGNHKEIAEWRLMMAKKKTLERNRKMQKLKGENRE